MPYSKIKIFLCMIVCLLFLSGCWEPSSGDNNISSSSQLAQQDPGVPESNSPTPVPEPATILLLFGAGAVGLAVLRKKFRKK